MNQASGKRILLICGWYYPDSVGGTETYVRHLGKELKSLGWEVFVAVPSIDEEEHNYVHDGLPIYRYPISLTPSKEELRGIAAPQHLDIFTNWVKSLKPDIVHFHSRTRGCSFYHATVIRQLGIPLFLTIHAADFMCLAGIARLWGISPCDGKIREDRCIACWLKNRGIPLWWLAWLFSRIPRLFSRSLGNMGGRLGTLFSVRKIFRERREREKILLSYFRRIIVVAKWLYSVLKINDIPEEKLYYSRHGMSKNISIPKPENRPHTQGKIRVGFIGRLDPVKGIHILTKAVRNLPQRIGIELEIYGRINFEEDRAYLKKIMRIIRGDPRIKFCGELSDKNYVEVMSGFDLIAVPSVWLETGPYIILEAFMAGIPVIGSNLGGIAELVTHNLNGMLVNSESSADWSRALAWIYNHPDILNTWVRHIPAVRSSREVAEEMDLLYRDSLAKKDTTEGLG
jgi:glycosyltransferase involved in cell wall biosynthesis